MYRVKQNYLQMIYEHPELVGKIAQVTKKEISTIMSWIKYNSPYLTMADVLYTVAEYFGVEIGLLTEKVSA